MYTCYVIYKYKCNNITIVCNTIHPLKKKKEILSWKSIEDIVLSEMVKARKDKYHMISILSETKRSQTHGGSEYKDGCQGRAVSGGHGEIYRFPVRTNKFRSIK